VRAPEVEELTEGEPEYVVVENARRKASAVAVPQTLTIGCDTEVLIDGELLGQPDDEGQTRDFLGRLSGREHTVLSGLVLVGPEPDAERSGVDRSTVTFHDLGEERIRRYLDSGEWRGRAGGYAIQGLGATLVAAVQGDLSNVIGLPIDLLLDLAPELIARGAF
jgi:septum formation protein